METWGSQEKTSVDPAVRKAFDDFYTALYEQPIDATPDEMRAMSRTLRENMAIMEKYLRDPVFGEDALRNISFVAYAPLETGQEIFPEDVESGKEARRIVFENRDFILEKALIDPDSRALHHMLKTLKEDPLYKDTAERIMSDAFAKAGLDYDRLRELWKKASNPKDAESALNIMRLDRRFPGLPATLNREFGIVNFRRYPESVLIRQYENRDRTDLPYGILLYPLDDHNGAFDKDGSTIEDFAKSLDGSFELRIVECDGKRDMARQLLTLDKRYAGAPEGHKISFAVIGGHGNENLIVFGGTDEKHRLLKSDFLGKGVGRTGSFFDEDATLIIVSCSTGKEGGIGQELSAALNATVIAPDGNTNLEDLSFDANSRRFDVKYQGVSTITYRNGTKL